MFRVIVYENSHYQDPDEAYEHGRFSSYQEAVRACRSIVDGFLRSALKPNMTSTELFTQYTTFGEDPRVGGEVGEPPFSAWDYAKERCGELCGVSPSDNVKHGGGDDTTGTPDR